MLAPLGPYRAVRVRLSQILRKSTAIELLQRQFTDSVKDIGMHFGRDVSKAVLKAEQEMGGRGFRQFTRTNSRLSSMNPEVLPPDLRPRKKRIVVLGSGWGAHAFVKVVAYSFKFKAHISILESRALKTLLKILARSHQGMRIAVCLDKIL